MTLVISVPGANAKGNGIARPNNHCARKQQAVAEHRAACNAPKCSYARVAVTHREHLITARDDRCTRAAAVGMRASNKKKCIRRVRKAAEREPLRTVKDLSTSETLPVIRLRVGAELIYHIRTPLLPPLVLVLVLALESGRAMLSKEKAPKLRILPLLARLVHTNK